MDAGCPVSGSCVVCLAGDVRTQRVQHKLLELFEKLSNTKRSAEDGLSTTMCYICVSLLRRCARFSDMALHSAAVLRDCVQNGLEVTKEAVYMKPYLSPFAVTTQTLSTDQPNDESNSYPFNYNNRVNIYIFKHEEKDTIIEHRVNKKLEIKDQDVILLSNKNIKNSVIIKQEEVKRETKYDEDLITKVLRKISNKEIIKDCTKEFKYLCKICEKRFNSRQDRSAHFATHGQTERRIYTCDTCNNSFILKYNLELHMKGHSDQPFLCSPCKKMFLHKSEYKKHMKIHSKEKLYICDRCSKTFKEASQLKDHIRIHTGEKPYVCDRCSKKFATSNQLSNHMLVHTGDKPYTCHICGKTFAFKGNLQTHMRTHTGDKPYKCNMCNMAFSLKCTLVHHTNRLHSEVGVDRPYACDRCAMSFTTNSTLAGHMTRFHEKKPYKCEKCHKSYAKASSLKEHVKTHTGERKHACDKCDRRFFRRDHLKTHQTLSKCALKDT